MNLTQNKRTIHMVQNALHLSTCDTYYGNCRQITSDKCVITSCINTTYCWVERCNFLTCVILNATKSNDARIGYGMYLSQYMYCFPELCSPYEPNSDQNLKCHVCLCHAIVIKSASVHMYFATCKKGTLPIYRKTGSTPWRHSWMYALCIHSQQ